ncbi:ABC transporter ATP-binding protein [Ferviditalea candida]|uniref:ABC transporter ATP-binding protein n=1 Tax=Ferviditalea candida TaxID=3108399 RepID=A0ABU5ZF53_9BACL|nr:ABC transporter ATP-binding protein [Paenibacillaceae bacterium T2]
MLEVKRVKVRLGETEVLRDISFHVETGERIGLIGPNGHGKTTAMKTISGIFKAMGGEILFEGQNILGRNPREIVELGIIHVPEGGHLFSDMTVYENLLMGAYPARAKADKKKNLELVYHIFPKLKLLSKNKSNGLSGGERRMLAVGRGLMSSPRLLMLDEPTLGVSPILVEEMGEKLHEIGQMGTSIILADENMDLISGFAERVYFIENGQIKVEGPTDEVLENEYVKKTYLGIE